MNQDEARGRILGMQRVAEIIRVQLLDNIPASEIISVLEYEMDEAIKDFNDQYKR